MPGISRIASNVRAHAPHAPSRHAKEMAGAAKGVFPSTILDQKLADRVQKMRPHMTAQETAKGGKVNLVYHFKTPAEAKAVYESATEEYKGKRFPSPSLGNNIAECLDSIDEVGDPSLTLRGSTITMSVGFKPST